MPSYQAPLRDMQFLLHDVFGIEETLSRFEATREINKEVIDAVLEEAARICEEVIGPLNQSGDIEGCRHIDGEVKTPSGFIGAYQALCNGGWIGLMGDPEFGGQGLPKVVAAAYEEMLFSANTSFALYPILSAGAALALRHHGTRGQQESVLPHLYSGRWSGTMCLTEPHAGSDLGSIRTRAMPQADGSYQITGTKIFITGGAHDLCENIVHLVLAKRPDAPPGSRGISMFLVFKYVLDAHGQATQRLNGVTCGSIEHKMGIKASATCVMHFESAVGHLVGELNHGLANMFTMMNYERLSMGLQGIGLAQASYQVAAEYAKTRLQGRSANASQSAVGDAVPIIEHPDVRRMLLTIRATVLAGRALIIYLSEQLDIVKFSGDPEQQAQAQRRVDLLTPVAKAFCTDRGFEACVLGQQVLGGHGYVHEWGQEQLVRDARIAQIYEGTNGIQAMDLIGRKTVRRNADLLLDYLAEIEQCVLNVTEDALPTKDTTGLLTACAEMRNATQLIMQRASERPDEMGSVSYPFLELLGWISFAHMWVRILSAVHDNSNPARERAYLQGIHGTGRFFMEKLFPRHLATLEEIKSGGDTILSLTPDQF